MLQASVNLLLLSVLLFGESVNGARRWINIAGLQFQPSEIAKFTMIVLFARLTRHFGPDAKQFRYGVLGFGSAQYGDGSKANTTTDFVSQIADKASSVATGHAAPKRDENALEKMEKLAKMKEDGIITEEEFNEKKSELLTRI